MQWTKLQIVFWVVVGVFFYTAEVMAITVTPSPSPGTANHPVTFTVSTNGMTVNCTIQLNYGDGVTQNIGFCNETLGCTYTPTHTYTTSGTYTITAGQGAPCAFLTPPTSDTKTLQIYPAIVFTSPSTLTDGTAGRSYSYQLQTTGGVPPVTYSQISGTRPPGLSLGTSGLISGTPTTAGTFSFTVRAADINGASTQRTFSITINSEIAFSSPSTLTTGTAGRSYSYQLQTTGSLPPVTYSLISGTLPTGLSLGTSGLISGTPTTAGTYSFTVRAADSSGASTQRAFSITINMSFVSISVLTTGMAGLFYSYQLQTTGGLLPVTYSLISGSLPTGLSLGTSGLISGIPSAGGNFSFWIRARDMNASTTEQAFSLAINMAPITVNATAPLTNIAAGTGGGSQNITHRFSSSSAVNLQLTSSAGNFIAGGETIATQRQNLQVTIQNGSGQVTETISIPASIIQQALARKANTLLYQRVFNYNSLTSTIIFNLTSGAGASFSITRMALYFENRRPEITVDKNSPKLKAFADINFVGSGLLQGYWEMDGRLMSYVNQQAIYGQTLTLATLDVPALPTFDPGPHSVRLVITNPSTTLTFPTILYYVVPQETKVYYTPLMPRDNTIWEYRPLFFHWETTGPAGLYIIEFFKEEETTPLFSAFTRSPNYQFPDLVFPKIFERNRVYLWRIKGMDNESRILGESALWSFRFK